MRQYPLLLTSWACMSNHPNCYHCIAYKRKYCLVINALWRPAADMKSFPPALLYHDDVIKWNYFPRYWPFVRGIHLSPVKRPVTRIFDVFFELRLNKWLSKQSWGWWFETPSWSIWRHCNTNRLYCIVRCGRVFIVLHPVFRWRTVCQHRGVLHMYLSGGLHPGYLSYKMYRWGTLSSSSKYFFLQTYKLHNPKSISAPVTQLC